MRVLFCSAAREIARLSALMSPVLSGVLVPMMSRAKHRNEEEFFRILRRGLEGVSVIALPHAEAVPRRRRRVDVLALAGVIVVAVTVMLAILAPALAPGDPIKNSLLDRLQEAREREQRLLDDASHELRTPLSILKAELDVPGKPMFSHQ